MNQKFIRCFFSFKEKHKQTNKKQKMTFVTDISLQAYLVKKYVWIGAVYKLRHLQGENKNFFPQGVLMGVARISFILIFQTKGRTKTSLFHTFFHRGYLCGLLE